MSDYLLSLTKLDAAQNYIQSIKSDHSIFLVLVDFFDYLSHFNQSQIHLIYILHKNQEYNVCEKN